MSKGDHSFDVAVVGIAGRFPGANTIEQFWSCLEGNIECITEFSEAELVEAGVPDHLVSSPNYVKKAPVLEGADKFDAAFFGYNPADAKLIDPQQRLLLEVSWGAIEDAGYDVSTLNERVGVFASTAMNTYLYTSGLYREFNDNYLPILLGSDKDFQATRLAFKLGLNGPSLSVQTACSSSLVALHLACQSILSGESDYTLVAASAIRTPLATGHLAELGSVFSPDGRCRPFDANANGTIFGSGCCAVLLKNCIKAIEDGDRILGLIKGSAVNNDGDTKNDFTAPSISKQAEVITEAMGVSGLEPSDVNYIEAHGTGTFIGDPIEIAALEMAWGVEEGQSGDNKCPIGSVKSNIGHLDVAAGLAGFTKVILAMRNKLLPATINFNAPNPQIDFESSPFRVVSANEEWRTSDGNPRCAGITSLGMGGTNAHVIVQEFACEVPEKESNNIQPHVFPVSAKSEVSLNAYVKELSESTLLLSNQPIESIARTLQMGRQNFAKRAFFIATSISELSQKLSDSKNAMVSSNVLPTVRPLIYLFPGQGSQRVGMGRDLYEQEVVFRESFDRTAKLIVNFLGIDIRDVLYPKDESQDSLDINATYLAQPCLFAVQLAYVDLLKHWGIIPDKLLGHSIGKYAAAVVSGIFPIQLAAKLVVARGRAMQQAPAGKMLSVSLSVESVSPYLKDSLEVAVVNSAVSTVVGGEADDIDNLAEWLTTEGHSVSKLKTSHAFHTSMLKSSRDEFLSLASEESWFEPSIPLMSDKTAKYLSKEVVCTAEYWADHIVEPVLFDSALSAMMSEGPAIFIELGSSKVLSSICSINSAKSSDHATVDFSSQPEVTTHSGLKVLGDLWLTGMERPWNYYTPASLQRAQLPTYPFNGPSYWFLQSTKSSHINALVEDYPAKGRAENIEDCLWSEAWEFGVQDSENRRSFSDVLFLGEPNQIKSIKRAVDGVSAIVPQCHFLNHGCSEEDPIALLGDVAFGSLVFIWSSTKTEEENCETLLSLSKLISESAGKKQFANLTVIASGVFGLSSDDNDLRSASLARGFVSALPEEIPSLSTRLLDVPDSWSSAIHDDDFRRSLFTYSDDDKYLWYRNNQWLSHTLKRISLSNNDSNGDLYGERLHVVLGGFGGIGRVVSRHIAANGGNVLLLTRQSNDVSTTVSDIRFRTHAEIHGASDFEHKEFLVELSDLGAKVAVVGIDITSKQVLETVLRSASALQEIGFIFQLAGVVEDSLLSGKSFESFSRVLKPKVSATESVLAAMTVAVPNASLVLFSSIASLLPSAGQIDYAAGNAFQMSLARAGTREKSAPRVVSIAWPGWRRTGMLSRIADQAARNSANSLAIRPEEGVYVLDRILSSRICHVYVAPNDPKAELKNRSQQQFALRDIARNVDGQVIQIGPTPESQIESVISVWSALLGFEEIDADDNFFDIGGNSLLAIRMCVLVNDLLGSTLTPADLISTDTPRKIVEHVDASATDMSMSVGHSKATAVSDIATEIKRESKELASRRDVNGSNALVPLCVTHDTADSVFLVHSHGGLVLMYQELARLLGKTHNVFGLQSYGVDGIAKPFDTIEEMANAYADEIFEHHADETIIVGGYCMGGTIAWETARVLKGKGADVQFVFMIQSFHKNLEYPTVQPSGTQYHDSARVDRKFLLLVDKLRLRYRRYKKEQLTLSQIASRSFAGLSRALDKSANSNETNLLRNAGGSEELLKVHKANGDSFWTYEPPKQPIPLLMLMSEHQPLHVSADKYLGWEKLSDCVLPPVFLKGSYLNSYSEFDAEVIATEIIDTCVKFSSENNP